MPFFTRKITAHLGYSHEKGRVREINEDSLSWDAEESPERQAQLGRIYVVADGMGGHASGEVASQTAVESVVQAYQKSASTEVLPALQDALSQANGRVYRLGQTAQHSGMGTTIVCAVVKENDLFLAHVGDSRAYLFRKGSLKQLTRDHTWVRSW